jgi:RimJ/RimL family protein N-acetyltransferase
MRFREATEEDIDFAARNSINTHTDRKLIELVDYVYVLEDDEPLGVGGFRFITPTTAWCWVDIVKPTITVYRTIKEWIDTFCETHKIRRLQAFINPDFPESINMVKHLGFEKESTMKNFFGDTDGLMYVRLIWPH